MGNLDSSTEAQARLGLSWDGNRIGGILLDAVGTLIEAHPPVDRVYAAVAREQGIDLDAAEVASRFRRCFAADVSHGALTTDETRERLRWERLVASVLPELPDPAAGFAQLWSHFGTPHAWRCFPDVGPAVRALQLARVPLCIGSNFDARLRSVVAGLPELAGLAECLVLSSEVGYRKPHAAFYAAACERLGLRPSEILSVGDDPEHDLQAPRRAGLHSVLIDREGRQRSDLPVFSSLTDLVRRLGL